MTEQEAIAKAKEIYDKSVLYTILSEKKANMIKGESTPFIGMVDNKPIIYFFDTYDKAKGFIDEQKFECLGGNYPIAEVDKDNNPVGFNNIINMAISLGIYHMDYNPSNEDAFGCQLNWFLTVNGLEYQQVSMFLSQEKAEAVINNNGINLDFNPMRIVNFKDNYEIPDEKKNQYLRLIFDGGDTVGDYFAKYRSLALIDCLLLLDYVTTKFIPSAMRENKTQDVQYFKQVEPILQQVVWEKVVDAKQLYSAIDRETGHLVVKNDAIYIFITNQYKYMGPYDYTEVDGVEGIKALLRGNKVKNVIVTDGPRYIGIIPFEKVLQLI